MNNNQTIKKPIGESSNGRTGGFEPSNLGSSPSSPANLWDRLIYLQTKEIRKYEIKTLDGYIPIHEGSNDFPVGSDEWKLRQQYLDWNKLRYSQTTDEISYLAKKLAKRPLLKIKQFIDRLINRHFHWIRRIYFRYKYGVSCCKAYGLYYEWAKQLLREVKGFREIARTEIDLEWQGFDKDIEKIIKAFELIIKEDFDTNKERDEKITEGLKLFAERFTHFWY